ncbi:pirin family protein [Mariprofundus sp. KV]|uniref:pirin family protein n=1 Tax=Mariprofundus sp. KV TaxID=2608715 RepID=UPI0015A32D84|nr:pirin family protein [Mariprofundus sp. KV]NWF35977.1 pirin family protein [Mariprofundus sp. KV]
MSISIHSAITVPEGDGVTVKRLMPVGGLRNFDPFVLWDHFDISGGGFPDHPHRGFEAITYLFDGGMNHADNLGNVGTIHGGGAQRFTAGSGIVHSEFPDGRAHGIQLWINLPQQLKSLPPAYQQVQRDEIPELTENGVTVRTIVGDSGAISLHTDVEYLEIRMAGDTKLQRALPSGFRGFIYAVQGETRINGNQLGYGAAAFIEDESHIEITSEAGARLMWCFGKPHHEPIYQHGPFVD